MSATTYAGIDYSGIGSSTNRDTKTGIRYGVISQNSLNPDALSEIFDNGEDLNHRAFVERVKTDLRSALSDYFSDHPNSKYGEADVNSDLDDAVESAFDAISDGLNDGYESDSSAYSYVDGNLSIQTCLDNDLFITNSPFFTFAQFCSPCVPGACNLDSPMEEALTGTECYCLGHDWFDGGKAPYTVYSVAEYLANAKLVEVNPA